MTIKPLLCAMLAFWGFLFTLHFPAQAEQQALMYRMEHEVYPTSYILGTYHSDSPALRPIFSRATEVINDIDTLMLELATDTKTRQKAMLILTLPVDVAGLHDILQPELFREAAQKIRPILGMSLNQFDRYKPWAIAILAQYPQPESNGIVLDEQLRIVSEKLGKQLVGLETIESQLSVFDSMPLKDQIAFLRITLRQMSEMNDMNDKIKSLYLAGDLEGMLTLSEEVFDDIGKQNPKLANYLKSKVISERNKHMVEAAMPNLKNHKSLIAIGALHLPGNDGMLAMLEEKGFSLTPMPIDFTAHTPTKVDAPAPQN